MVLSLAEEAQLQRPELPNELAQIDQVTHQPYQTMLTTSTGEPVPPMERLSKFYQRMNRAILDKAVIEQERDRLANENAQVGLDIVQQIYCLNISFPQLQDMIKQYLEGLTIRPDLLNSDNPLLVINGRASLNRPLHVDKPVGTIFKQEVRIVVAFAFCSKQ